MSMQKINLTQVVWDPQIYPRQKWNTSTIERYSDAIESGAEFPPIIVESGTYRLLDGKHRFEAHKLAGCTEISAEFRTIPDGMTAKYFAATLSARHGDRMSNADLKALAEAEFEANPSIDAIEWGNGLGVSKSTVYRWVGHLINKDKASRASKAWRLSRLGWTQEQIGERLGVAQKTVSDDLSKNSHLGKITETLPEHWNEKDIEDIAKRLDLPLTDTWAAVMEGKDDADRMKTLGINIQPYDVWNFPGCHALMGDKHPGRIPGELLCHVLYFFTQQGDLVIDPMAGSGTTLDACLLMGRKARGYDIDHRHERCDVEQNNIAEKGWPDSIEKANLIFWDPPYFEKMDSSNIGENGYIDGSISKLGREEYLSFFNDAFSEAKARVKPGTYFAFLMSDWDDHTGERDGIFVWDYADLLRAAGWKIERHIQCPLSTQQVHPDIVNKFRASRRLSRLERYLLISKA